MTLGLCIYSFYAINVKALSFFADSFYLSLTNLYCIDVFYQFK